MDSNIFSEYKEQYFIFLRSSGYAPASIRLHITDVDNFVKWVNQSAHTSDAQSAVQAYINSLSESGSNTGVIKRRHSSLRQFSLWIDTKAQRTQIPSIEPELLGVNPSRQVNPRHFRISFFYVGAVVICFVVIIIVGINYYIANIPIPTAPISSKSSLFTYNALIGGKSISTQGKIPLSFQFLKPSAPPLLITQFLCEVSTTNTKSSELRLSLRIGVDCPTSESNIRALQKQKEFIFQVYINEILFDEYLINLDLTSYETRTNNNVGFSSSNTSLESTPGIQSTDLISDTVSADDLAQLQALDSIRISLPLSSFAIQALKVVDGTTISLESDPLRLAVAGDKAIGIIQEDEIVISGIVDALVIDNDTSIRIGDPVTLDIVPGYIMKGQPDIRSLNVIGKSLMNFASDSGKLRIYLYGQPK